MFDGLPAASMAGREYCQRAGFIVSLVSVGNMFQTTMMDDKFTLLAATMLELALMVGSAQGRGEMEKMVFATYAQDRPELEQALILAKSLRKFGGRMSSCPFWLYLPAENQGLAAGAEGTLNSLNIKVHLSPTPESAAKFFYSGKTFAAGNAEGAAAGRFKILAWLDPDNVIVRGPEAFNLRPGISLGCRPVMMKLIGSDYSRPPDGFWDRIYRLSSVGQDRIFPVTTAVDRQQVRAYFNAGLLVVRPERGILRKWTEFYQRLYADPYLQEECVREVRKRIFLHQTALAAAVLATLTRDEVADLGDSYNYPVFMPEGYSAAGILETPDQAVTIRHDGMMYRDSEWRDKLPKGAIIEWLSGQFPTAE